MQFTVADFQERGRGSISVGFRCASPVAAVQDVILTAIGGRNVTQTIEGAERYPVNLRYPSELRDDPEKLARVLVPTPMGQQIPLGQLAAIEIKNGPPMIKSENARLNAWVQISLRSDEVDLGSWVRAADLHTEDLSGMSYNPFTRNFSLGRNIRINYLCHTRRNPT